MQRVIFLQTEDFTGLGLLDREGVLVIPLYVVIPLVKLGVRVSLGTVQEGEFKGRELFGELVGDELVLSVDGKRIKVYKLTEESLKRLSVFADMVDDQRFLSLLG
ncbi:MAG: hypothetical protein GU346_06475 [Thermocrinis sp.]|jgi:hypothetical protein|nr:hypothetical protein [Thermocrinis sp.]